MSQRHALSKRAGKQPTSFLHQITKTHLSSPPHLNTNTTKMPPKQGPQRDPFIGDNWTRFPHANQADPVIPCLYVPPPNPSPNDIEPLAMRFRLRSELKLNDLRTVDSLRDATIAQLTDLKLLIAPRMKDRFGKPLYTCIVIMGQRAGSLAYLQLKFPTIDLFIAAANITLNLGEIKVQPYEKGTPLDRNLFRISYADARLTNFPVEDAARGLQEAIETSSKAKVLDI